MRNHGTEDGWLNVVDVSGSSDSDMMLSVSSDSNSSFVDVVLDGRIPLNRFSIKEEEEDAANGNVDDVKLEDVKVEIKPVEKKPLLISLDSLKHGFYEDEQSGTLRITHRSIEVREIIADEDSLQIVFASSNPNDPLLKRYGDCKSELFEWHCPLAGRIEPDQLEISYPQIKMRKSDTGNWSRMSSSTSSIRASNYTPSRTYGSSLSSYRYTPSTYTPASTYSSSSYSSTSASDRALTRSNTASSATGRTLTRSDSLSSSSALTRSPSGTTGGYHRSLYSTPAATRSSSAYSPATYTPSYTRDSSLSRFDRSSYDTGYSSRSSIFSAGGTHSSAVTSAVAADPGIQNNLPSTRDSLGRTRSTTQIVTTRYGGPSVRDLNRMAAERQEREKKETEYKAWEDREKIREEMDPNYNDILKDFRKRADGSMRSVLESNIALPMVESTVPPAPPAPEQKSYLKKELPSSYDDSRKPTAKTPENTPPTRIEPISESEFDNVWTFDHGKLEKLEEEKDALSPPEVSPYEDRGTVVASGFTGLRNIGNTCFMNATLQMLVNNIELRTYFLEGHYKKDVNPNNVLGFGGRLASAFADFMQQMWSCTSRAIEPTKIKELVAEKASQFANFAQHDAHEFLSFLLDGLHEDLNRVKNKAVTSTVEADGRPDHEVSQEAWRNYLLRNDSIFVDLFHGQLKSRLQCPKCDRVSITFDPFLYLPVPFPKKKKSIKVFYWPLDPNLKPYRLTVTYGAEGTIQDLLSAVGEMVNEPSKNMRLMEVVSHRIHKVYTPDETVTLLSSGDLLYVFQVHNAADWNEEIVELYALQRQLYAHTLRYQCNGCGNSHEKLKACEACYNAWYCNTDCQLADWNNGGHREECAKRAVYETVGQPFLVSLPKSHLTYAHLMRALEARCRHSVEVFIPPQSQHVSSSSLCVEPTEDSPEKEVSRSSSRDSLGVNGLDRSKRNSTSPSSSASGSSIRRQVMPEPRRKNEHKLFLVKKLRAQTSAVGDTIKERKDAPEEALDLRSGSFLSINWHNMKNGKSYVDVTTRKELDIDHQKTEKHSPDSIRGTHGEGDPTLQEMIHMFSETERLKPEESWYCNKCKDHVEATKKMELNRLPPMLVIQLKRFVYTASLSATSMHRRSKDERRVEYPLQDLDLKPYLSESAPGGQETVYDLCGVVCHSGSSYFGHYISVGRLAGFDSQKTEIEWRNFDDSCVSKLSAANAQSDDAYLLFYKQRGSGTEQTFRKHYGYDSVERMSASMEKSLI